MIKITIKEEIIQEFKKNNYGLLTSLEIVEKLDKSYATISKTIYRMKKEQILIETQIHKEKAICYMLNEEFFPPEVSCNGIKDKVIDKMIIIFDKVSITDSSVYLGDKDFNDKESEFLNERINEILGDA